MTNITVNGIKTSVIKKSADVLKISYYGVQSNVSRREMIWRSCFWENNHCPLDNERYGKCLFSTQRFISITPEKVLKPNVFWRLQGA